MFRFRPCTKPMRAILAILWNAGDTMHTSKTAPAARRYRRYARWLAPILWMALIYWFSSRTSDDLDSMLPFFQWLMPGMASFDWGHFAAYFGLALTFEYALGKLALRPLGKALVVVLCLLYGVTDEYHQSFVDGRTPDPHDLRNDGIGALLAVLLTAIPSIRGIWRKLTQ